MDDLEAYGISKFSFLAPTGFLAPYPLLCGHQMIKKAFPNIIEGKALIIYIISGMGRCATAEGAGLYKADDLIYVYNSSTLELELQMETEILFILLENASPLPAPLPTGPIHHLEPNNSVRHMLERICRNGACGRTGSLYDSAADIFRMLMKLCSLCVQQEKKHSPVVSDTIDCMRREFAFLTGIDDLAERVGISKCHLIRIFSKEMGLTPGVYLQNVRLENAMLLLREREYGVDTIANLCGFSGANYFCKVFRKAVGESPGEYRGRSLSQSGSEQESARRLLAVESRPLL